MNICVYSPYIPEHRGGGEKYILDVARVLAEKQSVSVAIASEQPLTETRVAQIRQKYEQFLDQPLDKVKFIATPLGTKASWWQKLNWTKQFEVMYYLTDGSLFFSWARRNILHIQIPFTDSKSSLFDRLKLANWQVKNTNSEFTKRIIEQHWRVTINQVHYPMVPDIGWTSAQPKAKRILHVGRFFRQLHTKRQDILIEIFKQLVTDYPRDLKGWRLVLVGTVEDQAFAEELQHMAADFPIDFKHNLSRAELDEEYRQASIYWHATGYGQDESAHPEKMEHFGISTVEAMSAGCVPVVIDLGGQPEAVGQQLGNWTWKTPADCVQKTRDLISQPAELEKLRSVAQQQARLFGPERFRTVLWQMVEGKIA